MVMTESGWKVGRLPWLAALACAAALTACGGGDASSLAQRPTAQAALTVAEANTNVARAFQAIYGAAPTSAQLAALATTGAESTAAVANKLVSDFNGIDNDAFAAQVLANVQITAQTTNPVAYQALRGALSQFFAAYGPSSRGQIIANLATLLSGLQGNATFGAAATAFNNAVSANLVKAASAPSMAGGEGLYQGTTSNGQNVFALILENGETWGFYTDSAFALGGVIYGTVANSGGTLTGNGFDYYVPTRTLTPGSIIGTFVPRSSLTAVTASGTRFTGTYNAYYDVPATAAAVAGTYTGSAVTGGTTSGVVTATITAAGAVTARGDFCSAAGSITPRSSGKNVYNVSLTFSGSGCALANTSTTGIAYYDAAGQRVYSIALNVGRTDGFMFSGTKN